MRAIQRNPLILVGVGLLLVIFLIAGLLLPPIALGQRLFSRVGFTELTGDKPLLSLQQGLTVAVDPAGLPSGVALKLAAIANGAFLNGSAGRQWELARANLPSYLRLTGPVFSLELTARGEKPPALLLTVKIPSNSQPYDTLDLYAWDGERWFFVPSQIDGETLTASIDPDRLQPGTGPAALAAVQTRPAVPLTGTLLEPDQTFLPEAASALNVVAPIAVSPAVDGSLVGALAGGYQLNQLYSVTPVVRNHTGTTQAPDTGTLTAILTDPRLLATHVQALLDFAVGDGYDGLVLDYRGVDPVQRAVYATFIRDLAEAMHAQHKTLAVYLPEPEFDGSSYNTGGYDWAEIGYAADSVLVPVGEDPAAAGNGDNDRLYGWATRLVNRYKIQLASSSLGTDRTGDGPFGPMDFPTAVSQFGTAALGPDLTDIGPGTSVSVGLSGKVQTLDYDGQAFAPRFVFADGQGAQHTAWFGTTEALVGHLGPVQKFHLGGVTVLDLLSGGNMPGMIYAVARFRSNQAAAGGTQLALVWTVSKDGSPISQETGAPGAPFIWPADQAGPYEIKAALQGAADAGLGSVQIAVIDNSPTPTTEFSPTPSLTPTRGPTFTPCPDCPTNTPPPPTNTSAPAAVAPVAINPGALGAFELGGQAIHGGITYAADMKRAGMSWVKLQAYNGNDMGAAISNAHALGFHILLSVTDNLHASAPVTSPDYQASFGQYLAGLAAQGADAIEVWNEPNIDREWPTGQVSGAAYAQLLKTVYPMIKAANGNTIVISAAPAPTGFFGGAGCTAQGCNDDVFLQQVTAAGGANFVDCVGIHFNDGTTSPSATSGSALSGYHYSYYYQPMISTYRSAFNNARQLCFTELGFLTGEGYSPDLASAAPSFSWASGNTVAEQAQWLAEAATLSANSGVVRMMIVFNVDFTAWGADPQAGYAIIRPGGACPACDSLDAVMP